MTQACIQYYRFKTSEDEVEQQKIGDVTLAAGVYAIIRYKISKREAEWQKLWDIIHGVYDYYV